MVQAVLWYENPQWIAIIASIVVSVISAAVSGLSVIVNRRTRRTTIDQGLFKQRNDINESIMRNRVRGPFATLLKIKDDELNEFIPRTGALFLQLNLLEDVYQHRMQLKLAKLQSYESLAINILTPWIMGDPHLVQVLQLIFKTNDLMDRNFVTWVKMLIPIPEK